MLTPATLTTEASLSESIRFTGVFWMERRDWDMLHPHFADRENFPSTYEQWRPLAQHALKVLSKDGLQAIKVRADPKEFLRWCGAKGFSIDVQARLEYANEQAATQWSRQHKLVMDLQGQT